MYVLKRASLYGRGMLEPEYAPQRAFLGAKTSSNCQLARSKRKTPYTRLLCSSAAMMLPVPGVKVITFSMRKGQAGPSQNFPNNDLGWDC